MRPGVSHPPQPNTRPPGSSSKRGCLVGYSPHGAVHRARRARQDRAMRRKREKTPPPHPGPLRHSFISLKRRALAPRAWLSRLAALGGGEGERAAPSTYPLRCPGPLGPDGATAPRAYARSQASGASARRLRDKKKLGGGTGRGGFAVCAVLCHHVRNLACVRDLALTPATPYAAPTTFQARATRACATQARATLSPRNPTYPTYPT